MICAAAIEQQQRPAAERRDDNVDVSVIVDIAKSGASCGYGWQTWQIEFYELAIGIAEQGGGLPIPQAGMDLLHIVEHVALSYEQVFPAVVVEIVQPGAPAGAVSRQRG